MLVMKPIASIPFGLAVILMGMSPGAKATEQKLAVTGTIAGVAFKPDRYEILVMGPSTTKINNKVVDSADTYSLNLAKGKEFWPDQEVKIYFTIDKGRGLDNLVMRSNGPKFGSDAYRTEKGYDRGKSVGRGIGTVFVDLKQGNKDMPSNMGMHNEGVRTEFAFGKVVNGKVRGRIWMKLPSQSRTEFRGEFVATIKKL